MVTMLTLLSPDAAACGGFFCNRAEPIKQKGETIVFEIDKEKDRTTMHVQVEYAGPAAEFAWVIPVKGTPELALSSEKLFRELAWRTRPSFTYYGEYLGVCWDQQDWWGMPSTDMDDDGLFNDADGDGFSANTGVDVLQELQVGPYATAVVAAEHEDDLISWLQANDYAVPDGMGPVLAPYLADGHNFVALKLVSGSEVGDLEPLAMQVAGTEPAIPLHLTAIAAEDDMPLTTFVLSDSRAVPDNYLHVQINDAAVNWFGNGNNYEDLIKRAADQAGGHAFATDMSGPTDAFENTFYLPSYDLLKDQFEAVENAQEFLVAIQGSGLPGTSELRSVLESQIHVPSDQDLQSVFNNPNSYPELNTWNPDFDAQESWTVVQSVMIQPLAEIQGMFDRQPHITRLRSSISPHEMTLDPRFTTNPDIEQDVGQSRVARMVSDCDSVDEKQGDPWRHAKRELILPSGVSLHLPSQQWFWDQNLWEGDWLDQLQEPAASRIESLSNEGPPDVLWDGETEIQAYVDDLNEEAERVEPSAKGCDNTGGAALAWFALVLPIFFRRK